MEREPLSVTEDAPGAVSMPHPTILGMPGVFGAGSPARTRPRAPAPEGDTNPMVLPTLIGISLGLHVALVMLAAFLPEPAAADILEPAQLELTVSAPPVQEIEALPEPVPEPEVIPEPEPVVQPRRVAQPEPTPAPAEPPPPAPVMVAEGAPVAGDWAHNPGEEGGVLGGTPGGTGTGEEAAPAVQSEAVQPRRGLSRAELRRRVLAYIRGTLSSFVNGRLEYPLEARRGHMEGVVVLRLRLGANGQIASVRLSRTSGHDLLDRAALARVQGLGSMPAPPTTIPWDEGLEIPLPVTYRLR